MPDVAAILNSAALLLCISFLTYVTLILVPFLRERPARWGVPADFEWHLIVPCLNEEAVIERTVRRLLDDLGAVQLWCIDDNSDDRTGEILARLSAEDARVHVVSRRPPQARTGKGDALNAAWRLISDACQESTDRSKVLVGVVDADGRLDPYCFDVLSGEEYFLDPGVSAVQIEVRMINRGLDSIDANDPAPMRRHERLVVTLQDLEFRTVISAMQILRRRTLSVGMGGNGQFTRLSVLDAIAEEAGTPWHGSLLEDFELGVHVLLSGTRTEYARGTWVAQEGLGSVPALIRQRTRWAQGSMQCFRYLPRILQSRHISTAGAIEIAYFLMLPWIQLLGTLVYAAVLLVMFGYAVTTPGGLDVWAAREGWGVAILVVVFGIAPFAVWGVIYQQRCAPHLTRLQGVGLGLANWIYSYAHALAIFKAFIRVVRSRNDWVKTNRVFVAPTSSVSPHPQGVNS